MDKQKSTEFLEYIVGLLVERPEEAKVERKVDERGVLLTVTVGKADMGRLLGRHGAMANALRIVLKALGAKDRENVSMVISDPDPSRIGERSRALAVGDAQTDEALHV